MASRIYLGLTICLLTLSVLTGCPQSETTINVRDYAQACKEDGECVPVNTRRICTCDQTSAINSSDLDRYKADAAAAAESCPSSMGVKTKAQVQPCYPVKAFCSASGTCLTEAIDPMMPQN